jgi:flagellar biosynthesis protein FlhF
MRIKSYLAKTVDDAIAQARQELGHDALLLNTRKVPGQGSSPSRYEVMFGCAEEQPLLAVEEFRPKPVEPPKRIVKPAPVPREIPNAGLEKLQSQMDELRSLLLRSSFERSGIGRTVPELAEVYGRLRSFDVDAGLAKDIVDRIEARMDTDAFFMKTGPETANRWKSLRFDPARLEGFVRTEMEKRVNIEAALGGVVALVGPTGAGKTTTIMKIASAQKSPVRMLPLVTSGAGSLVQGTSATVESLPDLIAETRKKAMVLIDTPGYLGDAGPAAEILSGAGIDVHLVVPGYMRASDLRRCIEKYKIFNPTRLLVTKLDETEALGAVVSEAARTGLGLSFLTNGPSASGQIRAASVEDLVGLALDREQARAVCA